MLNAGWANCCRRVSSRVYPSQHLPRSPQTNYPGIQKRAASPARLCFRLAIESTLHRFPDLLHPGGSGCSVVTSVRSKSPYRSASAKIVCVALPAWVFSEYCPMANHFKKLCRRPSQHRIGNDDPRAHWFRYSVGANDGHKRRLALGRRAEGPRHPPDGSRSAAARPGADGRGEEGYSALVWRATAKLVRYN